MGKSREIPARHDLEQMPVEYIEEPGCVTLPRMDPFSGRLSTTGRLTKNSLYVVGRVPQGQATAQGLKPPDASFATLFEKENYNNVYAGRSNDLYQ